MANYTASPSMDFGTAIKTCFNKYCCFTGRARRSEYWYWFLFTFIIGVLIGWVPVVGQLVSLAFILPNLGVAVRRLHDVGRSGWTLLLPFGLTFLGTILLIVGGVMAAGGETGALAIIGGIILLAGLIANIWLLILYCTDGHKEANQYGESPKYTEVA